MNRKWLFIILAYTAILSGIRIPAGSLNLHLEFLVVLLCSGLCILLFLLRKRPKRMLRLERPGIYLILLWMTMLAASFQNAPDRKYSVLQTITLIAVSTAYFLMSSFGNTRRNISIYLKHSFNVTILISLVGTVFFFLSLVSGYPLYGINISQGSGDAFGIYLTMVEPNIYGCYMMVFFFLALSLYTSDSYTKWHISRTKVALVLIFSILGILLSFTRGVWLGTMTGLALMYFKNVKRFFQNLKKALLIFLFAAFCFYLLKNVLKIEFITYKLENFLSTEGGSGEGRILIWTMAFENLAARGNWLLGNGTYSFASFFNQADYDRDTNAWIGNMFITLLHDYGLTGISLFLCFTGSIIKRTRLPKPAEPEDIAALSSGVRIAIFCMFIEFFFTTGFSLSFCWILLGLGAGLGKILKSQTPKSTKNQWLTTPANLKQA